MGEEDLVLVPEETLVATSIKGVEKEMLFAREEDRSQHPLRMNGQPLFGIGLSKGKGKGKKHRRSKRHGKGKHKGKRHGKKGGKGKHKKHQKAAKKKKGRPHHSHKHHR